MPGIVLHNAIYELHRHVLCLCEAYCLKEEADRGACMASIGWAVDPWFRLG